MEHRAVVALDIGVLLWLSGLDILNVDISRCRPYYQFGADVFQFIIHQNNLQFTLPFDNLVQAAHQPHSGFQRGTALPALFRGTHCPAPGSMASI